ncbi:MAG: MOSC domain-containing protein [Melioribacteraceae bacterium]|nr:MAG: MOSC domain-containing protein [Melioribacteraceae bacterium]
MSNYHVSEIYIYPIKSLGGFSVESTEVTDRGFKHDRRWMLVDNNNSFLSQRKHKQMSLLQTELSGSKLKVFAKNYPNDKVEIPIEQEIKKTSKAIVWDDEVNVIESNEEINEWFSNYLNIECKLVHMPDDSLRKVDQRFANNNEITNLSDGYPFLIIGQESLNLLNSKLDEPLPINRFRPNLVFAGGLPHDEDTWKKFLINEIVFKPVKPCARCVITTIDQSNANQGIEPLKTLATYRSVENKVMFGMNLLHEGNGIIKIGDVLKISNN